MASCTRQYKEGILLKRARGLRSRGSLKWQERYCRLSNVSLDYFEPKKMSEPKGQFKVEQIQIVEIVSQGLFEKLKANPFQLGDFQEVMYFATKTPQERQEWMEAFRQAAKDKGVTALCKYHPGVYSLTNKDRWSCCGRALRETEGCKQTTVERNRSQITPINFDTPINSLKTADELSSSFKSTASNSTLTEQDEDNIPGMIRTYTLSEKMKKPTITKQKKLTICKSMATEPTVTPTNTTTTSPTTPTPSDTDDVTKNNILLLGNIPIEELTRSSGACSPAPSTDSGRGTTSRPSSMLNSEGEPAPLTPQSTRSQVTTTTTDSDQTKSLGGGSEGPDQIIRRKPNDCQSILSDISGLSGYSGTLPLHMRKRNRPQSIVYKDGVAFSVSEVSITSNESTSTDIILMKLHQACRDGNLEIVTDELDTGAPIGEQEIFNGVPMLPLFISFLYDHRHIMVYLLEHGADPNALDMTTRSCLLHWACQRGCLEAVKILINFKADVNMRNFEGSTPLCEASMNGQTDVVKTLLASGAMVDFEGHLNHTPLHYSSRAGHVDITAMLLKHNANPMKKNTKKQTPYHLAFKNDNREILEMLTEALPSSVKPYCLKGTYHSEIEKKVTSMEFISSSEEEMKLATGSRDCLTRIFSIDNECLNISSELQLANTILSVASHAPYIAMGSAFIQVADVLSDSGWRRTVADDTNEDESLEDPPLHLVSFTNEGLLVTAGVESNLVKIWPSISDKSVISQPLKVFNIHEQKTDDEGYICRLITSPAPDSPWIGAVLQSGPILTPVGCKKVHIYNHKEEKVYHIIDTGFGGLLVEVHITFTNDGNHFVIACKDKLTKWSTTTGDKVLSVVQDDGLDITCVAVSPDNRHFAIGLQSGDTNILDAESGMLIFPLRYQNDSSPVTSLVYSKCNSYLATGHCKGSIQLWKGAVNSCGAGLLLF